MASLRFYSFEAPLFKILCYKIKEVMHRLAEDLRNKQPKMNLLDNEVKQLLSNSGVLLM